jgi:hypothetical protein
MLRRTGAVPKQYLFLSQRIPRTTHREVVTPKRHLTKLLPLLNHLDHRTRPMSLGCVVLPKLMHGIGLHAALFTYARELSWSDSVLYIRDAVQGTILCLQGSVVVVYQLFGRNSGESSMIHRCSGSVRQRGTKTWSGGSTSPKACAGLTEAPVVIQNGHYA